MKKLKNHKNACAVLALCYCAQVPEDTAMRVCRGYGFTEERGMEMLDILEAAKQLGLSTRLELVKKCRIASFLKDHKQGLFLVVTHNHIFVIDNGIIIDPRIDKPSLRRIATGAWKVDRK